MELKTESEQVLQRGIEISEGKVGKDTSGKVEAVIQKESPLDEVRRLNKETKEMIAQFTTLKTDMENLASFTALSGRALAGKPRDPTAEEIRQGIVAEEARKLVDIFIKR